MYLMLCMFNPVSASFRSAKALHRHREEQVQDALLHDESAPISAVFWARIGSSDDKNSAMSPTRSANFGRTFDFNCRREPSVVEPLPPPSYPRRFSSRILENAQEEPLKS